MNATEIYQQMRRTGRAYVPAEQASVISSVRRLAAQDGLQVHQSRERLNRRGTRYQNRNRTYHLDLTEKGSDLIVAPDRSAT